MKLAQARGKPPAPYRCETIDVDGIVARNVLCLHHDCGMCAEGSAHWWFGTVDEHTHVYALRCELARQCNIVGCPYVATRESAKL